jgi:hypothetical protein
LASSLGVSSEAQTTESSIQLRGAEVCQRFEESSFSDSHWQTLMFVLLLVYVCLHVCRDTGLLVQWMCRRGLRPRAREPDPEPAAAGTPAAATADAATTVAAIDMVYTPVSAGSATHLFADCASMTQHRSTIRTATRRHVCLHCQRTLRLMQTNG